MKTNYAFLLLVFLLSSCISTEENKEIEITKEDQTEVLTKQLRHVVLFKFKEGTTPEDIQKVEAAFAGLPAKIPEIKGFEWGLNNSPEGLNKDFTHCYLLTFDSEAGRATYLPHPDHKAFGEVLSPYLDDVMVVDYWTK